MKSRLLVVALTLVTLAQGSAMLTLAPASGIILGTAGSTVGCGFSLSNASDLRFYNTLFACLAPWQDFAADWLDPEILNAPAIRQKNIAPKYFQVFPTLSIWFLTADSKQRKNKR